jgi:ketosteroid isomerase-like protein
MSEENVEIVRRLFDAVARRDTESVLALYDPHVQWDGSRHRWAEVMGIQAARWQGHESLRNWSRQYYDSWESLEDTVEELIDAGEQVVVIVTTRGKGRGSGIEVEWKDHAGLFSVRENKIVRVVWFPNRAEALAAAGLSE